MKIFVKRNKFLLISLLIIFLWVLISLIQYKFDFENLKLLAAIQHKISDEDIVKTLKLVNLDDEMNKKYSNYSLGMKQKLGIARVLMENPKVIILDEPFNGVENETVKKLRKVLLDEKEKAKIIILASHIKDDIEELADVVYEVDAGNVTERK